MRIELYEIAQRNGPLWGGAMRRVLLAFGVLIGLGSGSAAQATIQIQQVPVDNGPPIILLKGDFDQSDNPASLVQVVTTTGAHLVSFDSNGGNIISAMAYGRTIRQLGLWTVQLRATQCASACALAFIGGVIRGAEPGSIGVHQSSFAPNVTMDRQTAVETVQAVTAQIIAYLNEMDVDPRLLQLSLTIPSSDIRYLTSQEMSEFRVTSSSPQVSQPTVSPPSPAIASTPPTIQNSPSDSGVQNAAVSVVTKVMDANSTSNLQYLAIKASYFADTVLYYGKMRPKQDVMALEEKYINHWPIRLGYLHKDTITATCNGQVCTVQGLYDWSVSNPNLKRQASGTTHFTYTVDLRGDVPRIVEQVGEVVKRN